jgi:hypothetical protein
VPEVVKGVGGQALGGLAMPLQTLTDAFAEFDQSLRVVRETRGEPVLGPLKARIPGLAQTLPAVESPTREGPVTREAPLLRQLTGVTVQPAKNPLERELDRLGFTRKEILPSTGDPEADQLVAKHMGPIAEQLLGRLVQAPGFQGHPDAVKGAVLRRGLGAARQRAFAAARQEAPRLFQRLRLERLPRRERAVLEELGVGQR